MKSSIQNDKEGLVLELKDSVDSHVRLLKIPSAREEVRRDCAEQVLEAVVSFLTRWDHLEKPSNFPSGIIRDAFHTVLSEVGPGDAQVRVTLLETLASVSSPDSRQTLLDVMPWTMPVETKELEEATQQVLETLRQVLMEDSEALLPVLGCLSLLPLSANGRVEAWNVALASLPIVSEADLPVLARTLLCNIMTEEDASRALHGLRTEFELVENEKDDDPIPLIAHVLLGALQDRENGSLIAKAYLDILKDISTQTEPQSDQEEGSTFLILDAVAMLALSQNHEVKPNVEALMDGWIKEKVFPFRTFQLLLKTMCQRHSPGEPASVLYNRLVPSLLSLGMFLLLAPVRVGIVDEHLAGSHHFLLELHHGLDRDYQEEFVQCLLHLSEKTSWDPEESDTVAKKQRERSRTQVGKPCKRQGLQMTADAVHKLLQHLARTARRSVARFKHILVERLTSVSNDAVLDNIQSTEQLCAILSCLVEPVIAEPGSGIGIDASEVIILLQKLLFTASFAADQRSTKGESTVDVGRVIRGLILATELVKSEALSQNDKDCIHRWVNRILLPSTRRTVDPEIGSHGLRFLSAWSAWSAAAEITTGRPAGNEQSYDMFQSFKMILANTGLIQMLSLYLERRKRPQEVILGYTSIPSPFLKYSTSTGKRKKRDMIFCVHSYVRASNVHHPSRWGQMTIWVNKLVDTYLTIGRGGTTANSSLHNIREQTKWLPDGWLEACIELPNLNLVVEKTGHKAKKTVGLLSSHLCNHELTFECHAISKSSCSEIANGLCEDKNLDQVIEQVQSVLRLTLAFLLGIGLSAAVLRNTNAHSLQNVHGESRQEEGDSQQRCNEIVKLMQYQVMKLYDLKTKCESSVRLLEALATAIRRTYLPGKRRRKGEMARRTGDSGSIADAENAWRSASKSASTAETACKQTRQVLLLIFGTTAYIDPAILVRCLVDVNDEAVLIEGLKASSRPPQDFKMIVEVRRSLLNHLSAVSSKISVHNVLMSDSAVRVLSTASNVSRMLPTYRKARGHEKNGKNSSRNLDSDFDCDEITVSDVSGLSSSYFRFVKKILKEAAAQSDEATLCFDPEESISSEEKKNDKDPMSGSTSLLHLFVQCAAKMDTADSHSRHFSATKRGESFVAHVFNAFVSHLRICEDEATALELIDILSMLSSIYSELAQNALEACWRVLHTVYTVSHRDVVESNSDEVPHAFFDAVSLVNSRYKNDVLDSDNTGQLVDGVLAATIIKTATSGTRDAQDNAILQHGVLLMWSLTASSGNQCSFDYLSNLTNELVQFLDGIDDSVPSTLATGDDPGTGKSHKREKRDRPTVSTIQSLTPSSYALLFELVLHAIVGTFAIAPNARTTVTGLHNKEAQVKPSPFQHHYDTVQLFSRLLDVFVARFHLFPRRMIAIVLGACKHFLRVCIFQVQGCIQWRNAQPILSVQEKRAGVHDYGAIKFLEQLLQSFATSGASKVMAICQSVRQLCRPVAETDDEEDEDLLVGVSQNDKRFTSLLLSAQKTMDALREVAIAHNLVAPQFIDHASIEKLPNESAAKRRNVNDDMDKGYHELDEDEKIFLTEKGREGGEAKKKRRRIAPTLFSVDTSNNVDDNSQKSLSSRNPIDEDEDEWVINGLEGLGSPALEDDTSRTSSDEFGVSGQWGDEEDQDEESSSGSLELDVSNMFQAT